MTNNGTGVIDWPAWNNLTEEQRRFEMHRLLTMLEKRTANINRMVRWYASLGGFIGGSLTVLGIAGAKILIS